MGNKVIGVFAVCNTAGICVHEIDHAEDRVLASMNGIDPEWYPITEKPQSEMGGDSDEMESGFEFGSFFVPFSEVMRVYPSKSQAGRYLLQGQHQEYS